MRNPYCDRFLYSSIAPCHINGVTHPKLQALARRDTPASNLYMITNKRKIKYDHIYNVATYVGENICGSLHEVSV